MKRLSTVLVPLLLVACENPAFHNLPEIAPPTDGGSDDVPPTISNAVAAPAAVRDGARVTLLFDVSEELPSDARSPAANPEVTVDGRAMTCSNNNLSYSCARDIDAASETEGTKSFAIAIMDSGGNEANVNPGVTVDYDFTPPTLTLSADPTRVAPGGLVMFTVTANEPLGSAPTLNTTFLSAVSNCPSFDGNLTFHCEGTVDLGATLGPAVATATATDVAGNTATSPPVAVTISDQPPDTYTVGGTVTGLSGSGLVLQNNGGDDLAVTADGLFTFLTALDDGTAYDVTILVQPSSPDQQCTLSNGSGSVSGANVTDVAISCSTDSFAVGVTVSGLIGTGLVLQNSGGDDLSIPANGSYQFTTEVTDGAGFAVTVLAQPTGPAQTCAITGGMGTIAGAPVNVVVTCSTGAFSVGGDVTGLVGSGLILQLNGTENLPVAADGSFTFTTLLPDLFAYAVTVVTEPSAPAQTCALSNAGGNIAGAHVTNVTVTCATQTFFVGGTVIGLTGTGLTLQNNGSETLSITADGPFTFVTPLADLATYAVTISNQPTAQACSVSAGSGTISGAPVTSVVINCQTDTYTVGGTINGLSPSGSGAVLRINGGGDLTVTAPGPFTFPTPLANGTGYTITVFTQPTGPNQTCSVTSGAFGSVGSANVTDVIVDCVTTTYSVGGSVSGFQGGTLILQNNGVDDRTILSNGNFIFATRINDGTPYSVTVATSPTSPYQTCVVTDGTGSMAGADVTSVQITCTVDQFTVGGMVSGLTGSGLVLQNNTGDDEAISASGPYTFDTPIDDMSSYTVTVSQQPTSPSQTCLVSNNFGSVAGSNVTNVNVTCTTNTHTIGGTVSGLVGDNVVLRNNGGDDETVSANGSFTFDTPLNDGASYSVTVVGQPSNPNQTCTITSGGSGTLSGADVFNVVVTCSTSQYTINGAVTGLNGTVVLRNNGTDDLALSADGPFSFVTPLNDGTGYAVTVATQPSNPNQTCTLTNDTGTVNGADVNNVIVTCVTSQYTVGANVSGLIGAGLVLLNNGGNNLPVSGNGTVTFSIAIDDGSPYAVTVGTQPSGQTCSVTAGGSGTITGANVVATVACVSAMYTVGGTVTGLVDGNTVVLRNNGGDDNWISANGSYSFSAALPDLAGYAVTVFSQPQSPNQICVVSNPSGNIAGDHVTNVNVACTTEQFTVGGTVSGLVGSGLVLQLNGGDNLPISGDGDFTFSAVDDNTVYNVTVFVQPTGPAQTCTVFSGAGTVWSANVTDVTVFCSAVSYTVGGTVTGLVASGLELQNNGGDTITVTADGPFVFPTGLANNASYNVTVSSQPTNQTCTVSSGSGTIPAANVTSVAVNCVVILAPTVTLVPPDGSPIPDSQIMVFDFSEEMDPVTLSIDADVSTLLAAAYTVAWSIGNTRLTITPTGSWSPGALQQVQFNIASLLGFNLLISSVYDVIDTSSVIHVDGGTGIDTVSCGPVGSPCLTISHGLSRAYNEPMEAVFVLAGTYNETRTCGSETAVTMPPDVKLYGGFTTGFDLADRDPFTHTTTIQSNGLATTPPVQFTAYDDQCDDNPVSPSHETVVAGFVLENLAGLVAFAADDTGIMRHSDIRGDVELTGTDAIVGGCLISGNVSVNGGTAMVIENDITATGTVVYVSGGNVDLEISGNDITGIGASAIGVHIASGGAYVADNDINLTGATLAPYGVRDDSGIAGIEYNLIVGINGGSGGGWGVYGGDYVDANEIVLSGSAGDLHGIQGAASCDSNVINAVTATGTTYGLRNCTAASFNDLHMGTAAFDIAIDGAHTASFNQVTIDTGIAIRTTGSDVSLHWNYIVTSGGTGITFATAPSTYTVQNNTIFDADTAIEVTSGVGDVSLNHIFDCTGVAVSNVGTTGTTTVDANVIDLITGAEGITQSQSAATMTVIVTDNEIQAGTYGIAIAATNGAHQVRGNLVSLERTGTTAINGNYGVLFSDGAGGVIEDNLIGYAQAGVWLSDSSAGTAVRNNVITGRYALVITNASGGSDTHDLHNNTVVGRVGVYLDGDLTVDLLNNILVGADTSEHGIYVNDSAATPVTVGNNDIYDFATSAYRSATAAECTVGNDCTLAEMEAAGTLTASGNVEMAPAFVRFGGSDGNPTTFPMVQLDDYDLTVSTSCEVLGGGRDGSTWGYTTDIGGTDRTTASSCSPGNTGAAGWSMGAYERD